MGINICLLHKSTEDDHEYFDYTRHTMDGDFLALLDGVSIVHLKDTELFKPTNINDLYIRLNHCDLEYKGRYYHIARILENDEEYWLYISY